MHISACTFKEFFKEILHNCYFTRFVSLTLTIHGPGGLSLQYANFPRVLSTQAGHIIPPNTLLCKQKD